MQSRIKHEYNLKYANFASVAPCYMEQGQNKHGGA